MERLTMTTLSNRLKSEELSSGRKVLSFLFFFSGRKEDDEEGKMLMTSLKYLIDS